MTRLSPTAVEVSPRFLADFLGIRYALFDAWMDRFLGQQNLDLPEFDNEYFEWLDVLEATVGAPRQFVMFDLGAGYGRWLVRAVAVLKQLNPLPYRLVAVEAEPTHFRWLRLHLENNGIDPRKHELHRAAIADRQGYVRFHAGDPLNWWGQTIDPDSPVLCRLPLAEIMRCFPSLGRRKREIGTGFVKSMTLESVLARYEQVDLIDLDIQGVELAVLSSSIDLLSSRVKRLHVATHSTAVEAGLRGLFSENGWTCINDFPGQSTVETTYGVIDFQDGVQTWVNNRLTDS